MASARGGRRIESMRLQLPRVVAVLVSAALILTAPGLPLYQALALGEAVGVSETPIQAGGTTIVVVPGAPGTAAGVQNQGQKYNGLNGSRFSSKFSSWKQVGLDASADNRASDSLLPSGEVPADGQAGDEGPSAAPLPLGEGAVMPQVGQGWTYRPERVQNGIARKDGEQKKGRIVSSVERLKKFFGSAATPAPIAVAPENPGETPKAELTPERAYQDNLEPGAPANGPPAKDEKAAAKDKPAAPPAAPVKSDKRTLIAAAALVAGMWVSQLGVESWQIPWISWLGEHFGKTAYPTLTSVTLFLGLGANYVGGWLNDKLGSRWASAVGVGISSVATAAVVLLHPSSFAAVIAAMVVVNLAANTYGNAQGNMPAEIFHGDRNKIKQFLSIEQLLMEVPGIIVPAEITLIITTLGQTGTLMLSPITAAIGAAIIFMLVRPTKQDAPAAGAQDQAETPKKPKELDAKLLSIAKMGWPAFFLMNVVLYRIIAIMYGRYVHPSADFAQLSPDQKFVIGQTVSYFSAGGMIAAAYLTGLLQKIWSFLKKPFSKGDKAPKTLTGDEQTIKDLTRIRNSVVLGMIGLLGFVPMLWTNVAWATYGQIPFGIFNVIASIEMISLAQENMPADKRGKIMGAMKTAALVIAVGAIFGGTWLNEHYMGQQFPMLVVMGFLALVAAQIGFVALRLTQYIKTKKQQK